MSEREKRKNEACRVFCKYVSLSPSDRKPNERARHTQPYNYRAREEERCCTGWGRIPPPPPPNYPWPQDGGICRIAGQNGRYASRFWVRSGGFRSKRNVEEYRDRSLCTFHMRRSRFLRHDRLYCSVQYRVKAPLSHT